MLLSIDQFFGRFHPFVVHLPIGMLLLAVIFAWLAGGERYRNLRPAVPVSLLLGFVGAGLASLTGWLLSQSGEYAAGPLNTHKWMGVALTVVAAMAWWVSRRTHTSGRLQKIMPLVLLGLVLLTGHLGGNLTHGSEYLVEHLPVALGGAGREEPLSFKTIVDIDEALVYEDMVAPVLAARCYSCHGPEKQKGRLRLDDPEAMSQGGKSGVAAVVAGRPEESELLRRLQLPRSDKKHMPPKEKAQLSDSEIALLSWWIETGASRQKKVQELEPSSTIKDHLLALVEGGIEREAASGLTALPEVDLPPPAPEAIRALRDAGAVVVPVGAQSQLLSVNFINAGPEALRQLEPLAGHLTWLKLSNTPVTDSAMAVIGRSPNLTRLYLDHTMVTDAGLAHLQSMKNLAYLNLVGTEVTAAGIEQLKGMPALRELFLFQTGVTSDEWPRLTSWLPRVRIDTGGYQVPVLRSDTTVVTGQ